MDDASTVLGVDDRVAFFENYFCSHGAKDRARETKSPYGMGRTPKNHKRMPNREGRQWSPCKSPLSVLPAEGGFAWLKAGAKYH